VFNGISNEVRPTTVLRTDWVYAIDTIRRLEAIDRVLRIYLGFDPGAGWISAPKSSMHFHTTFSSLTQDIRVCVSSR